MAGCPVLQFTKTKAFRIAAVAALLVALYALAGFVAVPRMLRSTLMKEIPKTLGVTPTVGEIRFNPFLLQLEIKDFSLAGTGGENLLGFGRLFVDFELSSIWHRAYSFAAIDIDAPFVNAVVAHDGRLNLLQLSPKTSPANPPQSLARRTSPCRRSASARSKSARDWSRTRIRAARVPSRRGWSPSISNW